MKKIGFIDLFIDEWHSNNYPAWIEKSSRGNAFEVFSAWEEQQKEGRRGLTEWCRDMKIHPVSSLQEVVEQCDCFFVLAPANPEAHERLAELPLASGKPTYIDKPFSVDLAMGERLFERAERYHTPLMSSSALRFADRLQEIRKESAPLDFAATTGGGSNFPEYSIHSIEMIVSAMGPEVESVCVQGSPSRLSATLFFPDGRLGVISYSPGFQFSFHGLAGKQDRSIPVCTHHFENLLEAVLEFFETGVSPIPKKETLAVAAIRSAVVEGMKNLGVRIPVQQVCVR